jgi:hypothetical protein
MLMMVPGMKNGEMRFFRRHVRRDVETLHFARDLAREARRIEAGDAGDAGLAGEGVVPGRLDRVADRADDAKAGDDDSTTRQWCSENGDRPHFPLLRGARRKMGSVPIF